MDTRSARSFVSVRVAMIVAALGLTACDPRVDYPATSPPVQPTQPTLNRAQTDLARRVAATQLLDGSWGYTGTWYTPIDYTATGYQNLTGATALGLFDAYAADVMDDGAAEEMWFVPGTLEKTKDYLVQWMRDFVNGTVNPSAEEPGALSGTVPTNVSTPNFIFCKRYEKMFGLTIAEAATVQAAFDLLLSTRDASHGTDPTVIADGVFNRLVESRTLAGIPGLIGWDVAYYVRALVAMQAPKTEIDWVVNEMKDLPSLDPGIPLGLVSIAHVLTVLNLGGDTSMNATLILDMQSLRNPDGSYGTDASPQTTAFCLMALKAVGLTSDAATTQTWLESEIHVGGFVYDADTDVESYEQEGEMLWALVDLIR